MADIKHKLKKYKQYFEANPDGDKVLSVLRKLDALPVSIALLQDTGIGKVVNSFRKKPDEIGALAKSIVAKWKTLVTQEAKKTTQEVELKEEQYVPDSSRKPQKYEVTYKPTPIGEESPSGNEYSPQHVEQSYSPEPLSRQESIEPRYSPGNQSEENSDDDEYRPRSLSPKYSKKVGYSPTRIRDRSSEGEDEEYDPENVAVSNDQVYSPKSVSDDDAYDVATPEASASDQSASEDEEYNPSCITKESSKYQASYTPTPISESDKPHKSSKDSKYKKKDSSSSGKYQSNSSDRTKHSSHSDKHSSHSDKHSDKHSSHSDKHSSHRDKHSSHSDRHSSENDKHSTGNDKYSNKQSSNRDRHDSSKVKQSSKIDKQDSEKYRNGSSSSNQSISTSSSKKTFDKKTSNSDKKTSGSDKHSSSNDKESRHSDRKSSSYDKDKASVEGHKKSISVNTLPSSSDKRPSSGDKHSSTSNNKPSSSSKHSSSSDKKSSTSDNRPSSSNKHSSDNRPSSSNKHSSDNRTSSSSKHSSDKSPRSSDKHSSSSDKKSSSDKLPSKEKATKQSNHQYTEIKKSKSDKLKSEKRKIQPMVDTSDLFSPDDTAVIKKVKAVHRKPEENTKSTKNISHDEKRDSKSKSSSSNAVKSHSKAKPDKTSSNSKSSSSSKGEKSSNSKSSSSSKGEKRKKDEDETERANDITEGFSFDDFLNCDVKAVKKKPRKDVTLDLKPTGTKWSSSLVSSKPSTSRRAKNDDLPSTSFSMPSPAKQKIDIHESDILDLLPETNAHYRPLSKIPERKLDMATFDPMVIGTKTGKRTMVYSGKKHGLTEMKPLFGLCMQVLIDNIDALDYVGCIPYEILKPVLERCTVPQLLRLEDLNPHFVGDTEELWAIHCERDFKREQPDEMEAWREMYLRLQEEREVKLERLRLNMNKQAAAKPKGRQVQLAYVDNYVKPPRDVLRKQQRYGTAKVVAPSNSLHGASSSGKPRSSYNPHVAVPQPRMVRSVAPMMQKINKLIAKRRR